jgi:hypothetical protein
MMLGILRNDRRLKVDWLSSGGVNLLSFAIDIDEAPRPDSTLLF